MSASDTPDSNDWLLRELARAPRRRLSDLETKSLAGRGVHGANDVAMPAPGDTIDGRYELGSVLGSGGMGVVFAARNSHTGKQVALKYLSIPRSEGACSKRRAARFLREARAAGRVRHPNVVDMIDVGGDPDHPYLVMELLRGKSLYARMQQGPMPLPEAVSVMLSIMRGVAEAHRQGVIHRDIKPENIFLSEESTGLVPKVLDFGVSRITESLGDERPTTLTQAGNVIGTPSYMPLEQLRGKTDVDARADVYSLGVVLYELISGKLPFEAKNAHDLAIKMATEAPARLSLPTGAPYPALERVLACALSRSPADRYPSVDAFAAALAQSQTRPQSRVPLRLRLFAGLALLGAVFSWLASTQPTRDARAPRTASNEQTKPQVEVTHEATVNEAPASTLPAQAAPGLVESPESIVEASSPAPAARKRVPARATRNRRSSPTETAIHSTRTPAIATPATAPPDPIERAKTLRPEEF